MNLQTPTISDLKAVARKLRGRIIEMSHHSRVPHLGSALSCVDILAALYWGVLRIDPYQPVELDRDRFILSKGHAAKALYATLSARGFFRDSLLNSLAEDNSPLEEHPGYNCVPGVEAATGSLGHGLSLGIGIALAGRLENRDFRTFVLLGDGECNEGTVWEAAMFGSRHCLDHVVAVIDFNKLQATGRSCEILALLPLKEKWEAFGWQTHEIDGHEMKELMTVLSTIPDGSGRPIAVIAHTVKGKGVSFMEDDNNWHYRIPTMEEVLAAQKELGLL